MKCSKDAYLIDMTTNDQVKNITEVYSRFIKSEHREWGVLDDTLCYLEYIEDDQIYKESSILFWKHRDGATCDISHPIEECFVPLILNAVEAILGLYEETRDMHPNNRYILEYYLALSQIGTIVPVEKKATGS